MKKFKIYILILLILIVGILISNFKKKYYLDLKNFNTVQEYTFCDIIFFYKKYHLKKLKSLFLKYQIKTEKKVYLGCYNYSIFSSDGNLISIFRVKLLSTFYLIDNSKKFSFIEKQKILNKLIDIIDKNTAEFANFLCDIRYNKL